MNIAPYSLAVSATSSVGSTVTNVKATVGQPLTLTVFAQDLNVHQTLSINLQPSITSEKPSIELPRQRWLTDNAQCSSNTALTYASMQMSCVTSFQRGATWRRQIIYTPVISESGMMYKLNLQVPLLPLLRRARGSESAARREYPAPEDHISGAIKCFSAQLQCATGSDH